MPVLFCCAFGGYLARNTFRAHLHSAVFQAWLASEPRAQAFKTSQSACCKRFGCRILSCGKVQMLSFSTASEPVEMLVATVQQKVYQCVEAVSLSLVSVQMPGPLCCAFGGYLARNTFRAHLRSAVFQAWLASEPRVQAFKTSQSACCKRVKYRILSYCKVQMLSFSTASEPVEILVEASQWKVFQ